MPSSSARVRVSVEQASTAMTPLSATTKPALLIHQVPSCWTQAKIPSDTSIGAVGGAKDVIGSSWQRAPERGERVPGAAAPTELALSRFAAASTASPG